MPFTKVGRNAFKSPSGRTFTKKQIGLYYATDGFNSRKVRRKAKAKASGSAKTRRRTS